MLYQVGGMRIRIELGNGLYVTDGDSAMGKTYMFKLLSALVECGEKGICLIDYSKSSTTEQILEKLHKEKYDLIVLDRCDLYINREIGTALDKLREETCIFMDLKDWNKPDSCVPTIIDMELAEDEIVLHE